MSESRGEPAQLAGESVSVAELGKVVPIAGVPGYRIIDALDDEFVAATEWFRNLVACDRSPLTVRTYANSLLIYLRFLWSIGRAWQDARDLDTQEFVLWMRDAEKFTGAKRRADARPGVNRVTGPGVPRGGGLSGPRRRDRDGVSHRAMVSENDQELTQKDDTARWLLTSLPSSSCSGN